MTPPDALRRAAQLLEEARRLAATGQADAKLDEVRDICASIIAQVDSLRDPIETETARQPSQRVHDTRGLARCEQPTSGRTLAAREGAEEIAMTVIQNQHGTFDVSEELAAGVERLRTEVAASVDRLGGFGARVWALRPNGERVEGVLTRVANDHMLVIAPDLGKQTGIDHRSVFAAKQV